jgi:hypothetical protein
MPLQSYDDPFLPFGKAIIAATRDLVRAYVFDLAAYLALGAAGAVALERTIAYVGEDNLTVLHGAFVGGDYAEAARGFAADAVTLVDAADAEPYQRTGVGTFLLQGETLTLVGGALRLRLLGDEVLYAGSGEDFAERARAALERARQ